MSETYNPYNSIFPKVTGRKLDEEVTAYPVILEGCQIDLEHHMNQVTYHQGEIRKLTTVIAWLVDRIKLFEDRAEDDPS